jgi:hypothetical protein
MSFINLAVKEAYRKAGESEREKKYKLTRFIHF